MPKFMSWNSSCQVLFIHQQVQNSNNFFPLFLFTTYLVESLSFIYVKGGGGDEEKKNTTTRAQW